VATAFKATRHGIVASLDETERDLLSRLFLDVAELLEGGLPDDSDPLAVLVGIAPEARVPDDPALARLLPVATTEDDELAAEFRRFTEIGLRQRKSANLRVAAATLTEVHRTRAKGSDLHLEDDDAVAWLTALTDVRLVLAERLEIRTDDDADALQDLLDDAEEDDPRAWLAAVYDFLTWLQETLVHALSSK
jgi:Domain of unknown function (DUF2017)